MKLDIKQLPTVDKFVIGWGFMWRGLLITICSAIAGALIGGLLGFLSAAIGLPKGSGAILGGIAGIFVGIYFLYIWLRWILSAKLGSYRLELHRIDQQ